MANQNSVSAERGALPGYPKHLGQTRGLSAFGLLLRLLVPDGSQADCVALFEGRASWSAIEHWRRGHRQAPQWARDLIDARWRELEALKQAAMVADGPRAIDKLLAWQRQHVAQKQNAPR